MSNSTKTKNQKSIIIGNNAKKIYAIIISILLLFAMYSFAITPERYDLRIGQISPKTIVAFKDIVDEVTTEKEKQLAALNVEPSYVSVSDVAETVIKDLDEIILEIQNVQKYGSNIIKNQGDYGNYFYFEQDHVNYAKKMLSKVKLSDYQIKTLLNTSDEDIMELVSNMKAAVSNTLRTTIREGRVGETINYLLQIIGYKTDISLLQNVVSPILDACIKPNMVIDKEATNAAKQLVMDEVSPVVYQKGQNIVIEGNIIYKHQYEMLKSLGMVDDNSIDTTLYITIFLFIVLIIALMLLLMYMLKPSLIQSKNALIIQLLSVAITSGFCIVAKYINIYIAPTLLVTFLLTILVGLRAAIAGNIAVVLLNSIFIAGGNITSTEEILNLILIGLISGFVVIAIMHKKQRRQQALIAAAVAAVLNFSIIILICVFTKSNISDYLDKAFWSMGSAGVGVLLSLGLEPVFESIFNLPTDSKLLELCNPEHPLLKRLLLEAPGTYHHSIIVSNLAEAAAESIGANNLIARAGAYYHDIGKIASPMYFKENQVGINPHFDFDPYKSAEIITKHTVEGYNLAKQYKIPEEIRDIIVSHHGDSVAMYFYHEALEKSEDRNVDISKFRYPGPKPSTKEASIIMMADTCEAAVRSMSDHSHDAIKEFIKKLVDAKIEDGQLEQSQLTLKDIEDIYVVFASVLTGAYHERVKYPSISLKDEINKQDELKKNSSEEEHQYIQTSNDNSLNTNGNTLNETNI